MIRGFVAIRPPKSVAGSLIAAQAGLPAGRPVSPENLHITLAFLGEHPAPIVEDVHYAMMQIRGPAFELRLAGLALIGGTKQRVLCADVLPVPALAALQRSVRQAARGAGVALGRETYRPHVTLARLGSRLDVEDAQRMRDFAASRAAFRAGPFEVTTFVLVRSRLGRGGSAYEDLAEYPLNGG